MHVAVRIYAFAKDLGLDNKQLLEILDKVGIKGKGSALASLEDDEVARIKSFLADQSGGGADASTAAAPAVAEPTRDSILPSRTAPLRDLTSKSKPRRKDDVMPEPEVEVVATPPLEEESASRKPGPLADRTTVAKTEEPATEKPVEPAKRDASSVPPMERERFMPERTAPLRNLQPLQKNRDQAKPKREAKPKRPAISMGALAAMPNVEQPKARAKESGEKVQKPDIALPQDAIAKVRTGAAPLEQFTKQSRTKDRKKGGKEEAGFESAPARDARGTTRGKHVKAPGAGEEDRLGSTRQQRAKRRERVVIGPDGLEERQYRRSSRRPKSGKVANTAAPRKEKVTLQLPCTVRTFSEAAGVSAVQVLLTLPKLGEGEVKNINSNLDNDVVELLLDHFDVSHIELRLPESVEDRMMAQVHGDDDDADMVTRPPIVTFLGHVDHGKTSLLDAIIGIDVVSGEAGGITQHIRAYEVEKDGKRISFVDTPGHEAFTEMRARGANVTDIAVLVIAADDGVMPQTEEAISHAKAAKVPIIVAMNKIDLPGANPDKVYQDLAAHELLPSEWGGEVEVIKTSATNGTGIDDLLETILVTAELHEYKANPDRAAFGTCIEAEQQPGLGVVAKMVVQGGTLHVGDVVVCGSSHGRVKAMFDTLRTSERLDEAGPSRPVNITGLDMAPEAGDKFYVLPDIAEAREIALHRENRSRQKTLGGISTRVSLEDFQARLESGMIGKTEDLITLNLIIRADVRGSIEAIQKELSKIEHPEIRINILQALVGGVTIADVRLAQASEAVIIGFNVVPDEAARSLADELDVEIRRYDIIYKVCDDIKATLEGRLKPDEQVVELGMAMVLRTFSISRTGTIAGCRVMRGSVQRDGRVRVIRDSRIIGEYAIDSLKREKEDAKEVARGMECGIKLAGFNDIKEGDTLEVFKIEEVARTL
ncbi:MAG: translation initiation factor IF-2 [Pirellulaceae bacterium]